MGGNKYGKPTECCGTSFPNMIPKQQVIFLDPLRDRSSLRLLCNRSPVSEKFADFLIFVNFPIFLNFQPYNYSRENNAVVTDHSTQLHVNAVVEIKFVQSVE